MRSAESLVQTIGVVPVHFHPLPKRADASGQYATMTRRTNRILDCLTRHYGTPNPLFRKVDLNDVSRIASTPDGSHEVRMLQGRFVHDACCLLLHARKMRLPSIEPVSADELRRIVARVEEDMSDDGERCTKLSRTILDMVNFIRGMAGMPPPRVDPGTTPPSAGGHPQT